MGLEHVRGICQQFLDPPLYACTASASSTSSSSSDLGRRLLASEAVVQNRPSQLLLKQKQEGAKRGSDCRFVCLCFEIWSPKPFHSPSFFFVRVFFTLFLMIESKEQANKSSICLIENYTKQIVSIYIQQSVCS